MKLIPLVVAGEQRELCFASQLHAVTQKNLGALCRDYGSRFIVSSNKRELSEAGGLSIKGTLHNGRLLKAPLKFLDSALAEKPEDKLADPLPYKPA